MVGSTVLIVVPSVLQSCSKDTSTDSGNNPPPGGMDIGLCIFDPETLIIQFAAAHNSLYLIGY